MSQHSKRFLPKTKLQKPLPEWSWRKRIQVGVAATFVIGGISILIGLAIYGLGRKTRVFKSQSIEKLVLEKLSEQPEAWTTGEAEATSLNTCRMSPQMVLSFSGSAISVEKQMCSTLKLVLDDKRQLQIHLALRPQNKAAYLSQLPNNLTQVVSADLSGSYYETTLISAYRNNLPYYEYSLAIDPEQTITVTFEGGDQSISEVVSALVKSIRVL